MAQTPAANPRLQHLTTATFLATAGGCLDAIVYLNHGHVFANAMTGNVIFLGIAAVSQDWAQVLRHTAPILAFLLGVLAARLLTSLSIRNGALLTLAVEIVALFLVGFLPSAFPELAFTATVAFVSAFQATTFRRVGRFSYNSTFVTGNLREVAEGTFDRFFATDPALRWAGRAKSIKLALICLGFLAGAILGAFAAPRFPTHAIWFAEPMLLAVLLLILRAPAHSPEAS